MTRRPLHRLIPCLLVLLLSACAAGPRFYTHAMPDVDFGAYRTFGWPEQLGTDRGGYETSVTQYFKVAARREMEALGYRYAEENPDLLVNFYTNIEDKERTYRRTTIAPTLATGYYGYRFGMYTVWPVYATEVEHFHYQVGTANIDVVDAAERRLIWEGRVEGRLTDRALNDPAGAISDAVADIFQRFPTHAR
ncbi:DUF4136 domain-containing protein [Wenzhouxiangella marina]|uniref:Uncharacterized protein n=1 Tax=Wenzhouxiangella marina TaxID=1579979 RepID=A0A0K0XZW0_9GAMM|nr:DUF4136 domain-containing protein [Wenzhouxiangella marina]AKS43192.1 hypothetical protein WM2015_2835 [Wenzhouxiangella marina]MBB6087122.1 hypothetical protein [Wenzhouxiangella marina]